MEPAESHPIQIRTEHLKGITDPFQPPPAVLDESPVLGYKSPELAKALLLEPKTTLIRQESYLDEVRAALPFVHALSGTPLYCTEIGEKGQLLEHAEQRLLATPAGCEFADAACEYLHGLTEKAEYIALISGSDRMRLTLRTHFWAPELIWHTDQITKGDFPGDSPGIRINWSVGRPEGMIFTTPENLITARLAALYMENSGALRNLYEQAAATSQENASRSVLEHPQFRRLFEEQDKLLLKNPDAMLQVPPGWWSIHKVDSPSAPLSGTPHRASFGNREQPGLQAILTAPFGKCT